MGFRCTSKQMRGLEARFANHSLTELLPPTLIHNPSVEVSELISVWANIAESLYSGHSPTASIRRVWALIKVPLMLLYSFGFLWSHAFYALNILLRVAVVGENRYPKYQFIQY